MIELIEDPQRDFYSLVNEARDCLHTINRLGGPEGTYYKLSLLLREATPRFEWNEEDTRRFILSGQCRFHELLSQLKGKKQNQRDLLTLDDVIRIRALGAEKVEPLLQSARKAGEIPKIPSDLVISDFGQEINFIFLTAAAGELARDRAFESHILKELQRVSEDYLRAKHSKDADKREP